MRKCLCALSLPHVLTRKFEFVQFHRLSAMILQTDIVLQLAASLPVPLSQDSLLYVFEPLRCCGHLPLGQ